MCDDPATGAARSTPEARALHVALGLNGAMFVVGAALGLWAQSTGVLSDSLDMLADALTYGLTLYASSRTASAKQRAARYSGWMLVGLGAAIVADIVRRCLHGSEPAGSAMMAYAALSLAVNLFVLIQLTPFRHGEVHLRASYLVTRVDVVANVAVFACGWIVAETGLHLVDLGVGLAIGLYVLYEAAEVIGQAGTPPQATPA